MTLLSAHGGRVSAPSGALSPQYSAYLDFVRLAAAAMVVAHHLNKLRVGPDNLSRFIPAYGHEFVMVFFVLSGYVIAATVDRKHEEGLWGYAFDRAARMYSVVLPTLAISTLLSLAMWMLDLPGSGTLEEILTAVGLNLAFLGQSWSLNSIPPSNPAFWSLSYEVLYYALFGCVHFLRGRPRLACAAIVGLVAGPKILLLLPCWLAGVVAFRWRDRGARARPALWLMLISPLLMMELLSLLHFGPAMRAALAQRLGSHYQALAWSMEFPRDYLVATTVAMHLYAVRALAIALPRWLAKAAVRGAAWTFTLYLLHYPVIMLTKLAFGEAAQTLGCFLAAVLAVVATTWVVGTYSEGRRKDLRAGLAKRVAFVAGTA